jgi:hypothetical protein
MKSASQAKRKRNDFQKRHHVAFGFPCCSQRAGLAVSPRSQRVPAAVTRSAQTPPERLLPAGVGHALISKNDMMSFLVSDNRQSLRTGSPDRAGFQKRHCVVFGFHVTEIASQIPRAEGVFGSTFSLTASQTNPLSAFQECRS